jgi:hypothetical protein
MFTDEAGQTPEAKKQNGQGPMTLRMDLIDTTE